MPGAASPPRGGVQPGAAPPPRTGGSHAPGGDPTVVKWREAYYELQEERRRVEQDLGTKRDQVTNLSSEVHGLRDRLERERMETQTSMDQYHRRIETINEDNKRLETKLVRTQSRESAKDSEATDVKREVLEKTAAIERALRELQQQQQATLSRVKAIATSMLTACSGPPKEFDRAASPSSSAVGGRVETGALDLALGGGGTLVIGGSNMRSSGSVASLASNRMAAAQAANSLDRSSNAGGGIGSPGADGHRTSADGQSHKWFSR